MQVNHLEQLGISTAPSVGLCHFRPCDAVTVQLCIVGRMDRDKRPVDLQIHPAG